MYKKTRLNNGLRIITHRMPDRGSLSLGIWLNVGGRYEDFKNKGISHFLEHMLFKGTKKYSCRKLKESIEGIGGYLNGFTSEELTCYLVKIPAPYLERALDILSDMVLNPSLPENELTKEKTVILEEMKMYKDLPQHYVYDLLDELLWPKQPLGEPIIGTPESVSAVTRNDLRSFQQSHYTAGNIVVSAAGALRHEYLEKSVRKRFGGLVKKEANAFKPAKESQLKPQLKIMDKGTEQTHMAMGFHGLRRDHPKRHALGLLNVILGANMSSRLFNEVREKKGLAYEIGTGVKRFHDTGCFLVHAGIDNSKVLDAIPVILKELRKTKSGLVTQDEFRRAKEFYLGQLMLALEDTMDHMLWIGENTAALDKTYTLSQVIREVRAVSKEDIRSVALDVIREENLNLALIGPLAKAEGQIFSKLGV